MLPDIGLIIGLYVLTRYVNFIEEKSWLVKILSILFLLMTISLMGDLLTKGTVK